jgi:hypothetical protein
MGGQDGTGITACPSSPGGLGRRSLTATRCAA